MRRLFCMLILISCEPFGPGGEPIEPPGGGQGRLYLSTDNLDFGEVSVADQGSAFLSFNVRNTGTGLLKIAGLDRPLGDSESFSTNAPPLLELEPNGIQELRVQFTPGGSGPTSATLLPNGLSAIQLSGTGLAPALSINPEDLLFDSEPIGCSAQKLLQLTNSGEEDLNLESANITGSSAFNVDSDAPITLSPGESTAVILVFAPTSGNLHESVLLLQSNDPKLPVRTLSLSAVGFEGQRVKQSFNYYPTGRTSLLLVLNERYSVLAHADSSVQVFTDFLADLNGLEWQVAISNMSSACTSTPDPWMDWNDDTNDVASALDAAFDQANVGASMMFNKAISLLERTDEGDCLEGFLQGDSLLQVGFISDQVESSTGTVGENLSVMEDQLAADQELEIFSFSGTGTSGCPNTPRLRSAANDSQGVHTDLCSEELDAYLETVSNRAIQERDTSVTLNLAEIPVLSTLSVVANEQTIQTWQYISTNNQLIVNGQIENLSEGDDILVEYLAALDCE